MHKQKLYFLITGTKKVGKCLNPTGHTISLAKMSGYKHRVSKLVTNGKKLSLSKTERFMNLSKRLFMMLTIWLNIKDGEEGVVASESNSEQDKGYEITEDKNLPF